MRYTILLISLAWVFLACNRSPEEIPKFKKKFRAQIASFEKEKVQTDSKVEEGVKSLNGIQEALENAKKTDQEFNRVYGKWEAVSKQVDQLNKKFEGLKSDADNLFGAMERQTASIQNTKTRTELDKAIKTTKDGYQKNLDRTKLAIDNLNSLYQEAYDVVKGLEVAYALKEISNINTELANIDSRAIEIMAELTSSVNESKLLYDERLENI